MLKFLIKLNFLKKSKGKYMSQEELLEKILEKLSNIESKVDSLYDINSSVENVNETLKDAVQYLWEIKDNTQNISS